MENMGMTDKQFKFFLKNILKDYEQLKRIIKEESKEEALKAIERNEEDIKTTLQD